MPDRDEGTTEGPRQTTPPEDVGEKHEACIAEAWRLLSEGVYTFRAIARGVNDKTGCSHTHEWVKAALIRHGKMVAETLESGAIDSRAKYLQALYARRAAAAKIVNGPQEKTRDSDKIAALRVMVDCDEKIAAAEGVVTERKANQLTDANGDDVVFRVIIGGVPTTDKESENADHAGDGG